MAQEDVVYIKKQQAGINKKYFFSNPRMICSDILFGRYSVIRFLVYFDPLAFITGVDTVVVHGFGI